jgi:hypothetical protein
MTLLLWLQIVAATFTGGMLSGGLLWAISTWLFRAKAKRERARLYALPSTRELLRRERGPFGEGA